MVFLEVVEYGGSIWTASLRGVPDGELQLVFRAHSPESPIRGCICPLPPYALHVVQAAGLDRLAVLQAILAEELKETNRTRQEDEGVAFP
jgi:hypothetical protein